MGRDVKIMLIVVFALGLIASPATAAEGADCILKPLWCIV